MINKVPTLIFTGLLIGLSAFASDVKVNQNAPIGGIFNRNIGGEPPTIHPISGSDIYSRYVQEYIFDTLASRSPHTGQWLPRVAEKWEASKDNMTYTFFIRKNALWSDGKPVTAEDVKFSYDAIFEPAYRAVHVQPYYEGIKKIEVIDTHTVRFHLKDTYFQNFNSIAGLTLIPKHIYSDVEKSKKMNRTATGSGPYVLEKFDRGQRIVLKRRPDWYGFSTPEWKGSYNFETINLRFVKEDAVSFEMMKRNELDFMGLTPEQYVQKAQGNPWGKTVFKEQVQNKSPKSYGFIGWNFNHHLFQDKNVRLALYHLLNREEMIKKFRFGLSSPATGPIYFQSPYASSKVKPVPFDPQAAQALLAKSGWKDTDKDGVLDKVIKGQKTDLRFTLSYANKDSDKYWTLYREDLKKAGIIMDLKYLEWNSFSKLLDIDKDNPSKALFEAVALAWGGSFDWDPKQIWHSSSAVPGGSNFISYKNPQVDKLIDQARYETQEKKRTELLQKVFELIAADVPYAFLFNDTYTLYAHSSKIEKPGNTFTFDLGMDYWWSQSQKMR